MSGISTGKKYPNNYNYTYEIFDLWKHFGSSTFNNCLTYISKEFSTDFLKVISKPNFLLLYF